MESDITMNEIFDENGNYIYPTDIFLDKPNTAIGYIPLSEDMDVIGYKLADEVNTIIENQEEMDRIRTAHLFGTVGGCYTSNSTDNKEK